MLVLALLSMAVLPLMIGGVRLSAENQSLVAATSFGNSQLAEVRAAFSNDAPRACSALAGYARTNFPDPAGTGLVATRRATTTCGADLFSTMTFEVTVAQASNPAKPLVRLTTQILVEHG